MAPQPFTVGQAFDGYAVLQVKAYDAAARRFTGIATTPGLDRQGHSIDPAGVRFTNPLPLLFHHDRTAPVGLATLGAPTADGIPFEATIPVVEQPGALRDRVDEAWQSIQAGILRGVSIGFRVLEGGVQLIKGGGLKLIKTEVLELSLVTIPANVEATILTIKSAALGHHSAGVSATHSRAQKMTTREQITALENSRAAKAARMSAIMQKAADAGTTLDAEAETEYDGLDREVKSIDGDLVRWRRLETMNLAAAAAPTNANGQPLTSSPVVVLRSELAPGTAFTRVAIALARSKGNKYEAIEIAKGWKDTPEVELYLKAAVAAGDTVTPTWAAELAMKRNLTDEFIGLLRPETVIGRLPNLRSVPFNVSVPMQTAGGSYGWVGQGAAKPVTALQFGSINIPITKAAGIIVLTEELVRLSSPSAEAIVRADMIAGIAQFLDSQFLDETVGEVSNIRPASITNGIAPIAATANPATDLQKLIGALAAANVPLGGASLILSEANALALASYRLPNGALLFPGITPTGGSVYGITVVPSNAAGTRMVLVQGRYVLLADDGGVSIDVSREATIEMDSNPGGATPVYTSLFQHNLVGLRAERFINWKRVKNQAVAWISGAAYVPATAEAPQA